MKGITTVFFHIFFSVLLCGQTNDAPPLDIPFKLSGNFGEIRSNHFHSGIDIKTNGVTGLPVKAFREGFVSRIKVSPVGYGKAVYIDHPGGITTVYGHLDEFSHKIDTLVKSIQYGKEDFSVDFMLKPDDLIISTGEIIGLSGNSGSSGGPHLHFEIRDTKSEKPVNPTYFGFPLSDDLDPVLKSAFVYDLNSGSKRNYGVVKNSGRYRLNDPGVIPLPSETGFGVETIDYLNGSWSRCGIQSIKVEVDDKLIFILNMDTISFAQTRAINGLIDYKEYKRARRYVYKTWAPQNNQLLNYKYLVNSGILKTEADSVYKINITINDFFGNSSVLSFKGKGQKQNIDGRSINSENIIAWNKPFSKTTPEFSIEIAENTLFENEPFIYSTQSRPEFLSPAVNILNNFVPVFKPYSLSISYPKDFSEKYLTKLYIAEVSHAGNPKYLGGTVQNGHISTSLKEFGSFALMIDTIKPEINPVYTYSGRDLSGYKLLRFRINDNQTGIKDYDAYIDDKWALFDYDKKNNVIIHIFDDSRFDFGKEHTLKIKVTDNRDNINWYECKFYK